MNRDEARKLLSVYATGSLTEAERAALFQAALEDQELFDELAGEEALKRVLDEPGARQRLITALEPPRRHRAWLWAPAGATVAIAVVIGIVVSQRKEPPPPQEIAQVLKSPEPIVTPVSPPAPAPPVPAPPALRPKAAPAPPPEPPAELKKEERAALADQIQEAKPQEEARPKAPANAVGALAGAGGKGGAFRAKTESQTVSAFGFSYSVSAGSLEITPAVAGFLSVTAGDAVLFPSGAVIAEMPVRVQIPAQAASVVIRFSRMQGIVVPPVRRDAMSGTVMQVDAPNTGIAIELFLTPGTR